MYVCPNCGKSFAEPTNFCDNCGNAVAYQAAPAQPLYSTPVSYQQPAPSKGKNIAGMILGISGMVFSLIEAFYFFICLMMTIDVSSRYAEAIMAGAGAFCLILSIIALPLSIVGMALSNRKAFGMVGTIISGILLFVGIICLAAAA